MTTERGLAEQIVEKAKELGADLAGVADVAALKVSPSHTLLPKLESYRGVGTRTDAVVVEPGTVAWPEGAVSMIVLALRHPSEEAELDWWRSGHPGGTEGNRRLMESQAALVDWLSREHGIEAVALPYHIEHGGVFLKDAAVLAGVGYIGKNNLLVTPEFGPRVRLRGITVGTALTPTGPSAADPCEGCPMPCRDACPQTAWIEPVYAEAAYGQAVLPGRDGSFSRRRCNVQMEADQVAGEPIVVEATGEPGRVVRFCRECEYACIAG